MIRVWDDVLPNPEVYREAALRQDFRDLPIGPDVFRGIAAPPSSELEDAFRALLPIAPVLSFLRKSSEGQEEPNFIHSDAEMGQATGIFYLNPVPAPGDGTTFWSRNGETGGEWTPEIAEAARSMDGWTHWRHVAARFNRLLVFQSDLFHSRALRKNYGSGDDARMIQVVFAR